MAPPSRTPTPLDSLAPDQRATVELVLRQGRSYAELAALLGIPEPAVRERAHGALEALAPDTPPPRESARVADWLLGQQATGEAAATRALLARDVRTREWAATVAAPLRPLSGERVPEMPLPSDAPRPWPLREGKPPERRPRPLRARDEPATPGAAPVASAARTGAAPAAAVTGLRSSRLGGAVLLGLLGLVVAGFLVWFLALRGGDGSQPGAKAPAAAKASPQPTAQATGNDIVLQGPAGSKAAGLMRLFKASDGTVRFGLAAQGVPPNRGREVYAIWFARKNGSARRLGFAQAQVGSNGELTTAGPQTKDLKRFARWFASYDFVLVSRETTARSKKPGSVVLRGTLPHGAGS